MWLKLFSRASVVQLRNVYAGNEEKAGDFVRWRLATADDTPAQTLDEYINSWLERDSLRERLLEWMNDTPLLVAPVGATPALTHDTHKVTVGEQTLSTFRGVQLFASLQCFRSACGSCARGRSAEGLPIGVQIVGRPFAEATVLVAAAIVEEALLS